MVTLEPIWDPQVPQRPSSQNHVPSLGGACWSCWWWPWGLRTGARWRQTSWWPWLPLEMDSAAQTSSKRYGDGMQRRKKKKKKKRARMRCGERRSEDRHSCCRRRDSDVDYGGPWANRHSRDLRAPPTHTLCPKSPPPSDKAPRLFLQTWTRWEGWGVSSTNGMMPWVPAQCQLVLSSCCVDREVKFYCTWFWWYWTASKLNGFEFNVYSTLYNVNHNACVVTQNFETMFLMIPRKK